MPQPGDVSQPQPAVEDSFLDLLAETIAGLDEPARGQFLRQYFRTIAHVDLTDAQSSQYWDTILQRHRELSDGLGKKVSFKAAMLDVLASASVLRVPILMEYDELKKLQVNAATDALTGLQNRRLFSESCEKELNRAKRYGHHLGVVLIDLHKLKEVNDSRGHLEGDQVLQLAASTLRKTLRASDMAFRIGGDEFALLLPQTDLEQATTLCRRIRAQYEADVKPLRTGVAVTLDFGIAVHPEDGDQQRALVSVADQRLYSLKHAGRAGSRVIPMEVVSREPAEKEPKEPDDREAAPPTPAVRQAPVPMPQPPVPMPPQPPAAPARGKEERKWERV